MHSTVLINAILLCLLNASFMVAGIILNFVFIISLWRSSQLRKKLCYFMIIVLSCFDLAVVSILQPQLILSTFLWSMEMYHGKILATRLYMFILLESFSMLALLTLNIERFLALKFPYFHQTAVTKGKLTLLLAGQIIVIVVLLLLYVFYEKTNVYALLLITVFLLLSLFTLAFVNYKMLLIARSKRQDELRVAPIGLAKHNQEGPKTNKKNLKNISTCSLVVGCFFACSVPKMIFTIYSSVTKSPVNDRRDIILHIWASTFVCMNSTFNCLVFFWRNSILRREGMKILKCLRTETPS